MNEILGRVVDDGRFPRAVRRVRELRVTDKLGQFAVRADALAAPVSAGAREAATVFEDVRYLQRPGTETGYVVVAAADSALARLESAQGAPAEVHGS